MWSALGKYKAIVVSIALFLILDASVLTLNFYISFKIADDAIGVNLAGRQRMLSQRTVKTLYEIENAEYGSEEYQKALDELTLSYNLFNSTLLAFDKGGVTKGADGGDNTLKAVTSEKARQSVDEATEIWQTYGVALLGVINNENKSDLENRLPEAQVFAEANNLALLKLMNNLTVELENIATAQATTLRYIQTGGITLAIINFFIILFHFIGELKTNDRKLENARKETTDILNTVNEGLFLLNKDLRLGEQHSAILPRLFGDKAVENISFKDLISDFVKPKDLETAERFISLLFKPDVKSNLIRDLNPLSEVEFSIPNKDGGYESRFFNFDFSRVETEGDEEYVLVVVNDVTTSVTLASQLEEEKQKNELQMEMLMSVLHTNPQTLKDFIKGAFDVFGSINETLKDQTKKSTVLRRKLDDIFVEVHNFKGEASALDLVSFADLAHRFEDDIQLLRDKHDLNGNDFLTLAVHLDSLIRYTENIDEIVKKLISLSQDSDESTSNAPGSTNSEKSMDSWSYLHNFAQTVAKNEGKEVDLVLSGFAETEIDDTTNSLLNDILIQFVRNSIAHGLEDSKTRTSKGKNPVGRIDARLVRLSSGDLELSVVDDGAGIDYDKIRSRATELDKWKNMDLSDWSNKQLIPLIFEPGFSTAEEVGKDSGRGVGMNVIRKRINKYDGKLKISSRKGVDCQFVVTIPSKSLQEKAA